LAIGNVCPIAVRVAFRLGPKVERGRREWRAGKVASEGRVSFGERFKVFVVQRIQAGKVNLK
jgi:hypothetical protein